jgi:hypothetical protein
MLVETRAAALLASGAGIKREERPLTALTVA